MENITTDKGFKVLKMTASEAYNRGCGIENVIVCMCCNNESEGDDVVYYIGVLNDFMCEECFKNWHHSATYYSKDTDIEKENIDWMLNDTPKGDHKIHIFTF